MATPKIVSIPDPNILAVAGAVRAVAEVVKLAMESQTPAQRAKMWEWYINDVERVRKFFGMDK